MRRRRKNSARSNLQMLGYFHSPKSGALPALLSIAGALGLIAAFLEITRNASTVTMTGGVILVIFGLIKWSNLLRQRKLMQSIDLQAIDAMSGHAFEHYVGQLLSQQGYQTEVTRGSGDNGVDIIAKMNGVKWAIQCKRQASKVSRNAISDAVAATNSTLFNCSRSMVVTNNYFSKAAIAYARSTKCVLVDRSTLATWINFAVNRPANSIEKSEMALINCTECGKQISDRAFDCPGCGCPLVTEPRSSINWKEHIDRIKNMPRLKQKISIILLAFTIGFFLNPTSMTHRKKILETSSQQPKGAGTLEVILAATRVNYHVTALGLASYTEVDNKVVTIGFGGFVILL